MVNTMSIRAYIVSCLALLSLAFVQSCDDGMEAINDSDTVMVNIALKMTQDNGNTPRTDTGNDALNENVINSVDLFLYKQGGAASGEEPVFTKIRFQPTYNTATHSATISVPIPLSAYYQLFPNSSVTKCDAYIIANRPAATTGDNALPADHDMPSIKGNTVLYSQTFGERVLTQINIDGEPVGNEYNTRPQSDFVMEGFAQIDRSNQILTGSIPMERVAVKIGLTVDINTVDTLDTTWIPDLENVMVTMRGGINRTNVGTTHDKYLYSPNKQSDIFDLRAIAMNTGDGDNRTTKYPIYTYPTNWGTDEDCRTYFILTVNWTKETVTRDGESQGDGEQEDGEQTNSNSKTTYYEIPVNPAGTFLKRNTYYKINQTVEVLGSEDEENPVVLYPCNYTILGWGNAMADGKGDTDVEAEISKLKFLVLDETNVELNNTQSRQLYFFSSNPVEILNVKVEKNNVSGNVSNIQELANVAEPQLVDDKYTITSNSLKKPVTLKVVTANANNADSRNYIYFEHQLDNNMSSESDYSEYIVTFDVQHTGDSRYIETVRITQYPMISIKADLNYDYGTDGNIENDKNGYVFVNKNNTSSSSNSSWYAVYQNELADDGANANPNRYIISVSSITEELGDTYIIGDPRSNTTKNFGNNSGITTDSNGKALQYYYPTVRDTYTNTMISPEFMTASSYGRCPNSITSLDDAEKRCATYQEDGYPAGRWRLPTIAEIKYIVQLSGWGIIPSLFSTSNNQTTISYWSAHGTIKVMDSDGSVVPGNDNSGTRVVRCVYDTWYWGTEHDAGSTKFVYGDKER